jgi:hypothetical protein
MHRLAVGVWIDLSTVTKINTCDMPGQCGVLVIVGAAHITLPFPDQAAAQDYANGLGILVNDAKRLATTAP